MACVYSEHESSMKNYSIHAIKLFCFVFMCFSVGFAATKNARVTPPIIIDASRGNAPLTSSVYLPVAEIAPDGQTFGLNNRFILHNGKPILPVMGEFHYSRYPEQDWEQEILKMKAGGVNIISTYVIWIHQEEQENQFDWSGQRDLRHFVDLCGKHGMYVYLRIGPWAHAEVRNGGLPDWVLAKSKVRTTDPVFMSYVRKYYGQIAEQVNGQMWGQGGPIIGVQLDNEYSARGPGKGSEYIEQLKKYAVTSGLNVPFYSVTGWDDAVVPQREVLPMFDGYPAAPWEETLKKMPPADVYCFHFVDRGNCEPRLKKQWASYRDNGQRAAYPYLTTEVGGGNQDTYHRRPVISPEDVGAMLPTILGSGANLLGIYMFQGGENPDGLKTLQESHATGYPNDLPIKNYDFQAPLGEYGQMRPSFKIMKLFNYFLNDYGAQLAPMVPYAPLKTPKSASDLSVPRVALRTDGYSGFIFTNNYVRQYTMPTWIGFQTTVKLPGETLRVPESPINIPSGSYFIWPVNLRLDGALLKYSTAQPFMVLRDAAIVQYVFFAIPGIPSEFVLDAATIRDLKVSHGSVIHENKKIRINFPSHGANTTVDITAENGKKVRILLLSHEEAENAWNPAIQGKRRLMLFSGSAFWDESQLYLRKDGESRMRMSLYPELENDLQSDVSIEKEGKSGIFQSYSIGGNTKKVIQLRYQQTRVASPVLPVQVGAPRMKGHPGVASAPEENWYQQAASWNIYIPQDALKGCWNAFLQIQYVGDEAQLRTASRLLDDDYYNGTTWEIGLKRYAAEFQNEPLKLDIHPLRSDAPIYFQKQYRPAFQKSGQTAKVLDIRVIPEYQAVINAK